MSGADFIIEFPESITIQELNRIVKQGTDNLQQNPGGNLILDLSRIPVISSLVVGSIIRLHNLYNQQNRRVVLRNVSPDSREMLVTTGLSNVLTIESGQAPPVSRAAALEAAVALSVKLDFEFHDDIGIFKFSGSMGGANDSELCLKTVEKIVNDQFRMLLDISRLVPLERLTDDVFRRLEGSIIKSKGKIRIYCSDPVLFNAYRFRMDGSAVTLYATRQEAVRAWIMTG